MVSEESSFWGNAQYGQGGPFALVTTDWHTHGQERGSTGNLGHVALAWDLQGGGAATEGHCGCGATAPKAWKAEHPALGVHSCSSLIF